MTRGPSSTRRQAAAAKQPRSLHFLSAFSFAYNNNLGRRKDADDDADADEVAEDELPVRPDRPTDRPPRDRPLHLAQ